MSVPISIVLDILYMLRGSYDKGSTEHTALSYAINVVKIDMEHRLKRGGSLMVTGKRRGTK
jgi:hypothetical protein